MLSTTLSVPIAHSLLLPAVTAPGSQQKAAHSPFLSQQDPEVWVRGQGCAGSRWPPLYQLPPGWRQPVPLPRGAAGAEVFYKAQI